MAELTNIQREFMEVEETHVQLKNGLEKMENTKLYSTFHKYIPIPLIGNLISIFNKSNSKFE